MSSAWGQSFGPAWGNAWGAIIATEAVKPGGGGAARGSKRARPVIVWRDDEVEELVAEAVAAIQARPPKRGPKKKHKALFGPTAVRLPTQKQVVAAVRRIEPDGPTVEQILAAFARIRELDDEEAALMLFGV